MPDASQAGGGRIIVYCFFARCQHYVSAPGAEAAHNLMEKHYRRDHAAEINRIVGTRSAKTGKDGDDA